MWTRAFVSDNSAAPLQRTKQPRGERVRSSIRSLVCEEGKVEQFVQSLSYATISVERRIGGRAEAGSSCKVATAIIELRNKAKSEGFAGSKIRVQHHHWPGLPGIKSEGMAQEEKSLETVGRTC